MSSQMPGPQGQPPEKKGMSTGAIVGLVILASILLVFGFCVVAFTTGGA